MNAAVDAPIPIASEMNRHRRKRPIAAEDPCCISDVLQPGFEGGKATLVPIGLLHLIDAAERASGRRLRITCCKPAVDVIEREQLQVCLHIVVERRRLRGGRGVTSPRIRASSTRSIVIAPPAGGPASRPSAPTRRCSSASCRRPERVMVKKRTRRFVSLMPHLLVIQPFCSSRSSAG